MRKGQTGRHLPPESLAYCLSVRPANPDEQEFQNERASRG